MTGLEHAAVPGRTVTDMEHEGTVRAGEGRLYTARGSRMLFKALGESDDGDFSLMERTLPPGGRRPPMHRHTDCSEAYFVLAGRVSVELDGRALSLEPEDFMLVPRGAAHSFGNVSEAAARLLVIHAPAKDRYFSALHDLWRRDEPPTKDDELALMAQHGMTPA
jgi:mannose-6-phosphate isomerase-like protein (cupin superfamily)